MIENPALIDLDLKNILAHTVEKSMGRAGFRADNRERKEMPLRPTCNPSLQFHFFWAVPLIICALQNGSSNSRYDISIVQFQHKKAESLSKILSYFIIAKWIMCPCLNQFLWPEEGNVLVGYGLRNMLQL